MNPIVVTEIPRRAIVILKIHRLAHANISHADRADKNESALTRFCGWPSLFAPRQLESLASRDIPLNERQVSGFAGDSRNGGLQGAFCRNAQTYANGRFQPELTFALMQTNGFSWSIVLKNSALQ
jgi:hypothetical protein